MTFADEDNDEQIVGFLLHNFSICVSFKCLFLLNRYFKIQVAFRLSKSTETTARNVEREASELKSNMINWRNERQYISAVRPFLCATDFPLFDILAHTGRVIKQR